jgi:hypothetical protein
MPQSVLIEKTKIVQFEYSNGGINGISCAALNNL